MMNEPSLPGRCDEVEARRVLVLAPHFDDEILGCGGLLLSLRERGAAVHVVFLTDGGHDPEAGSEEEREAYRRRRRQEAAAVAQELGGSFSALGLPDGGLADLVDRLAEKLHQILLDQQPELVLLPSPLEVSRDHRAAFAAVHTLFRQLRGEAFDRLAGIRFLAYEVNFPQHPDLLVDVSARLPRLEALMGLYASQQERHDYWAARRGLLAFRTLSLPAGAAAAEAYRRLAADDFRLRGPAALIEHLGGQPSLLKVEQGPLLSVVVRTKNRPQFLAEALAGIARSTYGRLEVVLVNDGGAPPSVPEGFPFPVRLVDLQPGRGRAGAANAGIAAASGDYVGFLDDDDLVEPEHFEILAGLVAGAGVRVAYTDAAVGVYEPGGPRGWREVERRLPYSRDFDPELLLLDNYIPFHTLLFERRLYQEAGPLDESLPFFEDWEFLIRLARLTTFHHLPRVTCEYRHFRGAGHHILGDRPREAGDFLAMRARVLEKHAASASPRLVAGVVDRLRAETVAAEENLRQARDLAAAEGLRLQAVEGRLQSVETHNLVLADAQARAREQLDQLRHELEAEKVAHAENRQRLDGELTRAYAETDRLDRIRLEMEGSRAWRLHRWLEKFRR
jgi:LmbE family N-acetylglucosaminyl deacetylase